MLWNICSHTHRHTHIHTHTYKLTCTLTSTYMSNSYTHKLTQWYTHTYTDSHTNTNRHTLYVCVCDSLSLFHFISPLTLVVTLFFPIHHSFFPLSLLPSLYLSPIKAHTLIYSLLPSPSLFLSLFLGKDMKRSNIFLKSWRFFFFWKFKFLQNDPKACSTLTGNDYEFWRTV